MMNMIMLEHDPRHSAGAFEIKHCRGPWSSVLGPILTVPFWVEQTGLHINIAVLQFKILMVELLKSAAQTRHHNACLPVACKSCFAGSISLCHCNRSALTDKQMPFADLLPLPHSGICRWATFGTVTAH